MNNQELIRANTIFQEELLSFNPAQKELLELSQTYCINQIIEYLIRKKNHKFSLKDCLETIEYLQCHSEG